VTGNRAPWSSHIAVIPRLRAITPVLIDCGDHFVKMSEVDAPATFSVADEWISLQRAVDVRCPSLQHLSMVVGTLKGK